MAGPSAQPAAPHDRALPPNHGPIQADLTFTHREAEDSWRQTLGVFALATLLVASALVPPTQPASAETTLGSEITVGARPIGIALNPATNRVYVTNVEGGSVSVIDSETEAVVGAPIQTSAQPALVAVNPTTNRVYVTHPTANAVTVIDGATNTVIGSPVAVGMSPIGVAVNSLTNRVYVANNQSGSVTVLDGATNAMIGTPIIFLVDPQVVAVNPVTNRAYVASYQNGLIYVIDGATNTLMGPPIGVRERPVGIAVNTVTNRIFVANSKTNDVTVIDGATNTVVAASIPVGLTPAFLDVNVSTNRVYVATYGSSAVTVINGANHGIIGPPIPVGLNPEGVALHPGTNRVYVTNINSGTVSVVGVPFSTSTETANSGGTLSATWSGLYGPSGSNYVGLFEVGAKQIATPLSQVFTNGTASSGGPGLPAGSVKLPIPPSLPAGRYEVRLVAGPTGGTLARAGLTVVNEVPVAKDDTYTVNHGSVLTVPAPGVLANDVDADSPSLQATVVTAPTNGTLNLQPNGAFTYTPRPSFAGTDRFTYRASDETSQSATGTVTITVAPVACGPRPTVRTSTAVANGALQVTVNVSDVDGPTHNRLKELRFGSPVNGRIELAGQSQTAAFTHTVPAATDRVSFAVRRVSPGQPTTVPLTVVDECGTWPTLVGGGTGAGF